MSLHPQSAAGPRHTGRLSAEPDLVTFDRDRFDRLATGEVSSDVAHLDDLADLECLLEVLDPRGRDFGTDVADLVASCLEHRALRLLPPVTSVSISPTVLGESRDGGFLVLVTVAGACTLASDRTHTGDFDRRGITAARAVLATVAATACALYDAYLTTATTTLGPGRGESRLRSGGG